MKSLEENIVNRLIFIKYLYTLAFEQSYRQEPFCRVSILMFHDSVELFNQLTLELKGNEPNIIRKLDEIRKKRKNKDEIFFMDYWDIIEDLGYREAMYRFNKARVEAKHRGLFANKTDIDNFRSLVTSFFEQNTAKFYSSDFSELSLIDLIQHEPSKNNLKEAQQLAKEGKIAGALDNVALSFSQLIRDYEGKKSIFRESPFSFKNKMRSSDVRNIGIDLKKYVNASKFFNGIIDSIKSMQGVIKILSLGIDYKKYAKFDLLTPKVTWSVGDVPYFNHKNHVETAILNIEDVEYCISFVIETAILLQNIDYELERERYTHRIKRDH